MTIDIIYYLLVCNGLSTTSEAHRTIYAHVLDYTMQRIVSTQASRATDRAYRLISIIYMRIQLISMSYVVDIQGHITIYTMAHIRIFCSGIDDTPSPLFDSFPSVSNRSIRGQGETTRQMEPKVKIPFSLFPISCSTPYSSLTLSFLIPCLFLSPFSLLSSRQILMRARRTPIPTCLKSSNCTPICGPKQKCKKIRASWAKPYLPIIIR